MVMEPTHPDDRSALGDLRRTERDASDRADEYDHALRDDYYPETDVDSALWTASVATQSFTPDTVEGRENYLSLVCSTIETAHERGKFVGFVDS